MRMYWVILRHHYSTHCALPLRKANKDDRLLNVVVVHDIYEVVQACCYCPYEGHLNLTLDIARRILEQAQFEEGEESASNINAIQDLMEIFPDLIQGFGVDYRPEESIPEDYYA